MTCPRSHSKPAAKPERGPMSCTSSFTQVLGLALPPPSALTTIPFPRPMKPLPCSLSDALDRLHPWAFLACLSCHLLQDMTLIHGILDLWKGVDRPSPGLLTASLLGQSLRHLSNKSCADPALFQPHEGNRVTNNNSKEGQEEGEGGTNSECSTDIHTLPW